VEAFDAGGVTGIVWRRVRPGEEEHAEGIMREFMALARQTEGFLGSEIFPPIPGLQDAYVVLYRFRSGANLRTWLNLERREQLFEEMGGLLLEPAKEFFFVHGRQRAGTASSVFAYRIRPEKAAQFQRWRSRIMEEVRTWEGFIGTESFDAPGGAEPEFIVVVRFDSRPHLDAWLRSPEHRAYMREVGRYVERFSLRRVGSGFEGWFDHSPNTAPPVRWRQALLILSALFPVIMIMRHLLAPLFARMPMPSAFLILLALDLLVLTYVVMPHYSPRMDFWLRPRADTTAREQLVGWIVILGLLAGTLVTALAAES
jgi:antibiotic biosynthesis monooxygenase (ABM) superfamily enzyme